MLASLYFIRMYASPAAKRPRPGTSRQATTYHHRSGMPSSTTSASSHGRALVNPRVVNSAGRARLAEEIRENTYRDITCSMCSTMSQTIRHTHFSSSDIRRMMRYDVSNKDKTYMCPVCKDMEPVTIPATDTRRIVLADSSLYGVWEKMPPSQTHYDIDSIVGGRVKDMTRALRRNYLHLPNRLEIIVVAGINNIGAKDTAENIINDMKDLKKELKEHSDKWHHNPPSYVSFSTIMYAPKFCSLTVPPNPPEPWLAAWIPPPSFQNRYQVIKLVNDWIIESQRAEGMEMVRIDYTGIKRFKSGTKEHKFDNKQDATPVWREQEVFKKLHFTMDIKVKIMAHISSCFISNSEKFVNQSGHH